MIGGVRQTPADHYLDPALERENLSLTAGVIVDRVVLEAGRAVGIEVLSPDGERVRLAADEVILALGTYVSPACLLRSGIGPVEEIARHGITVRHELPAVGRGMQDHPKVSYRFWMDTDAPAWPAPWIQALLTADALVAGEPRRFQVIRTQARSRAGTGSPT